MSEATHSFHTRALSFALGWMLDMMAVKIIYDPSVNSLTVWFEPPSKDYIATQVEDDLILMKDSEGVVLGFEKHFFAAAPGSLQVQFEALPYMSLAELLGYEAEATA